MMIIRNIMIELGDEAACLSRLGSLLNYDVFMLCRLSIYTFIIYYIRSFCVWNRITIIFIFFANFL